MREKMAPTSAKRTISTAAERRRPEKCHSRTTETGTTADSRMALPMRGGKKSGMLHSQRPDGMTLLSIVFHSQRSVPATPITVQTTPTANPMTRPRWILTR